MKKGFSLILLPVLFLTGSSALADGADTWRDDWRKYYDAGSVLGGQVFDEASAPLADAVVTVARIGVPSFSLSDTSDGDGAWMIGNLMPGAYVVKAEREEYLVQYYDHAESLLQAAAVNLARKDTVINISFHLKPGATISGAVYMADGASPLAETEVFLYRLGLLRRAERVKTARTDAAGLYRFSGLATGSYLLKAAREGYTAEYYQEAAVGNEADTVMVTAPEEKTDIHFTLDQTSAITGIVTAEATGMPIPHAWIAVYDASRSGDQRQTVAGHARSDQLGVYTLSLPAGRYRVRAEAYGYAAEWFDNATAMNLATPVAVSAGMHSPVDFALTAWGSLSGHVLDAVTAAPIAGAAIRVYNEEKNIGRQRYFETISLDDGFYVFAGLPSGRYVVEAQAKGYMKEYWQEADSLRQADLVTMESGHSVTGIDFTLSAGAAIQGRATDAENGQPIADAVIEVQSVRGRVRTRGLTDGEGRYFIGGLPPGAYLASAAVAGYVPQWYDSVASRREAKQIVLASSEIADDIDFKLGKIEPLPVTLSGLVIDDSTKLPLPGVHIMAMPVSSRGRIRKAITGEDGAYVLRGLPPAKYLLLIHAVGYKAEFYDDARTWKEAKLIEVVAGQEIASVDIGLCPQPVGAYQCAGRVLDQSGTAIEGALIVLRADEEVVAASVTAEDGSYTVEGLPADSYVVSASVVGCESAPTLSTSLVLSSTLNVYGLTLRTSAGTTDAAKPVVQPERFALEQNHPNPFNPSTQIQFTLAQPGTVLLTVYDMLGREVKQLVNGSLAAGRHSVQWDGSNERGEKAASGVYFYRLQAFSHSHTFTQLRRMLLIK